MSTDAIIIGAGPSGFAMAYTLKRELDFEDFAIYEKMDGFGGTSCHGAAVERHH